MAEPNIPSIKSIAAEAGVSVSTVSRVLNTPEKVNPAMRERVEAAIRRNNYRPNPSAQGFRRKSTGIYGALLPHYRTESFSKLLSGAVSEAAKTGRSILLSEPYDDLEQEKNAISNLIDKPLDGLMYLPRSTGYDIPRIDYFKDIPIVGLSRRHISFASACVTSDNRQSGYLAAQYLLRLGRRDLIFVAAVQPGSGIESVAQLEQVAHSSEAGAYAAADRYLGFRQALSEAGVDYDPQRVLIGEFRRTGGIETGQRILSCPGPIDGVVAASDMTAAGIISVLQGQGIDVPGEISVVGCNDDSLSSLYFPSITTIRHDSERMGRLAVQMLNDLCTGKPVQSVMTGVTLVARESTTRKR